MFSPVLLIIKPTRSTTVVCSSTCFIIAIINWFCYTSNLLAAVETMEAINKKRKVIILSILFLFNVPLLNGLMQGKPKSANNSNQTVGDFTTQQQVTVWDNVVPPTVLADLHKEASKSGLGHKAFTRFLSMDSNPNLIERILEKILSELDDESTKQSSTHQYVEYWTRQEWRHIEAHADVDEHLAKEQDKNITDGSKSLSDAPPFRFPSHGHVLYLQVGSEVKGPTCLFPNRSSGGDLLKVNVSNCDDGENSGDSDGEGKDKLVDLVVVPAVEGRLLRFEGDTLHAVPRPSDFWFLSFVKGAPQYTPEETWGRSVILFNTYDGEPPKDVPLDSINPTLSESSNNEDNSNRNDINDFSSWNEVFSFNSESEDDEVCTAAAKGDSSAETTYGKPAKIWLLGNERRRDYRMRTIKLNSPVETRDLLQESHLVSRIQLSP